MNPLYEDIKSRKDAEQFIDYLSEKGWIYHFDDGAIDCLYGTGACSKLTARWVDKQIDKCYTVWGGDKEDCPIGYALTKIEI